MSGSSRFWDRIARRYARQPITDEATYEKKLEETREHLRSDMNVLELGCGTGSTALRHAPFVAHVRAIDFSPRMIEIARARAESAPGIGNVRFECAAIEDLDPAAERFDAVLALNVLHLLEDPDAVVEKVYALLEPGGVFVSSTACLGDGAMKVFGLIAPIGRVLGLLPRLAVFSRNDLEAGLVRAGFRIEQAWQPGPRKAVFIVAVKPTTGRADEDERSRVAARTA